MCKTIIYIFYVLSLVYFTFLYVLLQADTDRSEIQESGECSIQNDKECLICHKQFNSVKQWHNHYKICKNSLICKKCNKIFETLHTYDAHVGICDGVDRYKCLGCNTCFTGRKKAYNHMYNCRKKLSCKRCNMPFQEWKSLLKHYEIAHPKIECEICHSFFTSDVLCQQHMRRYHHS